MTAAAAERPWLMIITALALITAVQWPNSIAELTYDYNSYKGEQTWSSRTYNHRLKRFSTVDQENTTSTTSQNIVEEQRLLEPRIIMRQPDFKNPSSSNLTKTFKNEYSYNSSKLQPSNGLKSLQAKHSSTIIFPTNEEKDKVNAFIPEQRIIEKCSMNESFCIKVDNYPSRQDLLRIFRTSKFMSNAFFGVDTINDLETRITTNLQPFCDSLEEVIFPEAGVTKSNEWRFIVQDINNDNNNFKQGIRVEKCVNVGETCKFSEHLPTGYTTTCVQKYIYKKLVAIKDSKEIYYESFKLPSCCSCMYSVNPEFLTRKSGESEKPEN